MSKSTIDPVLRAELASDPEYSRCSLQGYHECDGRCTWEHALYYGGKKIQKRFAIIPLCAQGHGVDQFQDAGTVKKEMREWVALNRATEEELQSISKVVNYFRMRDVLNKRYGTYIAPPIPNVVIEQAKSPLRDVRKKVSVSGPDNELDREARSYARINGVSVVEARELLISLI